METNVSTKTKPILDYASSPSTDAANDQKRRSSQRSIKRKRFDDEIVEFSLGIPPTPYRVGARARTQSQTYVGNYTDAPTIVGGVLAPPAPVPTSAPPILAPPAAPLTPIQPITVVSTPTVVPTVGTFFFSDVLELLP